MKAMNYNEFIEEKKHSISNYGIECKYLPDGLFEFQKYVSEYAIKKGRCAVFLDTGTGKTIIELVTAVNYIRHTNKPVLIITPLAVAFQFIKEAEKFGIDDIAYSKDGNYHTKIVICNYERLDKFNPTDFDCVILDESSILKNFDGAIKTQVTSFLKKVKYRYLFTATPSPNDFVELGTSSEALGYMGYTDMLTKFFTNNEDTIHPMNIGTQWILKGHAKENFFKWVSGWSISMRKPSDLGFDDSTHILPELIKNYHPVKSQSYIDKHGQMSLFHNIARRLTEIKDEQRNTIQQRCEKASELVDSNYISFLWCNLNDEGEILESLIPNSINISGSDSLEKKEEAVLWFVGEKCICNSKNFNLNWQKNKKLCGSQNMQQTDEKNTNNPKRKEISGNYKVELLMKIRNTCQDIIRITSQNSQDQSSKTKNEIEGEENCISLIQNIGIRLKNCQEITRETIQTKDLREILNNMVFLLMTIKKCLKNKKVNVQFANHQYQEMERTIDYILTIVIKQEELGDCFAQTVISESDILTTIQNYLQKQQCTCGYKSGIRRLISKPKIFGFGLNFQHCNHTTYFPTFSYEQYYQSIRRFWRFGQTKPVIVDIIYSDGQKRVLDSILAKTEKADELFTKLNCNIHQNFDIKKTPFDKQIIIPNWLNK